MTTTPADQKPIDLDHARLGFANFDSARQGQIEAKRSDRRGSALSGQGEKEDRFGLVSLSQNSQNLTARGITYLQENRPEINLVILSHSKYAAAPKTSCLTRSAYRNTPYFKPAPDRIHRFALRVGVFASIGTFSARLWSAAAAHAASRTEELQKNFFHVASDAFLKAIDNLSRPEARLLNFLTLTLSAMTTIGIIAGARLIFSDASHAKRFAKIDKEFSGAAEFLKKLSSEVQQKNDPSAKAQVYAAAARLRANLPLIEESLTHTARLNADAVNTLILKLSLAANQTLRECR